MEKYTELNMDANEMMVAITQRIEELNVADSKTAQNELLMQKEKVKQEIVEIKVETKYK